MHIFGWLIVLSAFMVISVRNSVHSVIALVVVFFSAAGLYFIFGFEYLALVLVIVYVGAIAVLFLFVVMMLNIRMDKRVNRSIVLGIIGFIIYISLLFFIKEKYTLDFLIGFSNLGFRVLDWSVLLVKVSDMEVIGLILYTRGFIYVILAGLVLLLAMIGSIVLTFLEGTSVKRQDIFEQNSRQIQEVLRYKNI